MQKEMKLDLPFVQVYFNSLVIYPSLLSFQAGTHTLALIYRWGGHGHMLIWSLWTTFWD